VINSVLAELENVPNFNRDAVVIRLHGFFQTDDRIAIQEITRQLFMEKESANKVFGSFAGIKELYSICFIAFLILNICVSF
jgi:origin recognition complex subunit 4